MSGMNYERQMEEKCNVDMFTRHKLNMCNLLYVLYILLSEEYSAHQAQFDSSMIDSSSIPVTLISLTDKKADNVVTFIFKS